MSWYRKQSSIYTVGRKLGDGSMYIIDFDDLAPAGILIQAYKQDTSDRYTLPVSESELVKAGISRSTEALGRLAESVDIYPVEDQLFIHACLDGISKPKIVPTGDKAKAFIHGIKAGTGTLEELLVTGLSELCKIKPDGLDAVRAAFRGESPSWKSSQSVENTLFGILTEDNESRWLGEWLLTHNPNKPRVRDADDEGDGMDDKQGTGTPQQQ